MKKWKACLSPAGLAIRNQEKTNENNKEVINPCGEKPKKPVRSKGLNHEEYKQTPEYIEYRKKLSSWKDCININKNKQALGPCGEKPKKPIRAKGLNHEEYRQTPEHIGYLKKLNGWKDCVSKNK